MGVKNWIWIETSNLKWGGRPILLHRHALLWFATYACVSLCVSVSLSVCVFLKLRSDHIFTLFSTVPCVCVWVLTLSHHVRLFLARIALNQCTLKWDPIVYVCVCVCTYKRRKDAEHSMAFACAVKRKSWIYMTAFSFISSITAALLIWDVFKVHILLHSFFFFCSRRMCMLGVCMCVFMYGWLLLISKDTVACHCSSSLLFPQTTHSDVHCQFLT